MKETRKLFVASLNYCKKNRQRISDNIIAQSHHGKKSVEFWKEVKKRRNDGEVKVSEIDGLKTKEDIANLFYNKFSSISGTVNNDRGIVVEWVSLCLGCRVLLLEML